MLRRNPLAAMALHHPSQHLADAMPQTNLGLPDSQQQVVRCPPYDSLHCLHRIHSATKVWNLASLIKCQST